MKKITAIIQTYNAEMYLRTVLDFVKDFDEVLICDMHSTDQTISIAEEYGCTIIYHEHTGYVEAARSYAIKSAKYEWVLVVDADEIVPARLKDYLYEQIEKEDCPDGIRIPIKYYFMGRFMRSNFPNYILRFFKRDKTDWPPFIHSQPKVDGVIRNIPAKRKDLAFIHLSNDSVNAMLSKTIRYTENEIVRRKDKKYGYFSLMNETIFRFFKHYILKGGILDGKAGLVFNGLNAFYKYATIAKIWESRYKYNDVEEDLKRASRK